MEGFFTWDGYYTEPKKIKAERLGISGQLYDENGEPVGNASHINTNSIHYQYNHDVIELSDNGFVVTWKSNHLSSGDFITFMQRFDSAGQKIGAEFEVGDYNRSDTAIELLSNDNFFVVWHGTNAVWARLFDASGLALGDQFELVSFSRYFADGKPKGFIATNPTAVCALQDGY